MVIFQLCSYPRMYVQIFSILSPMVPKLWTTVHLTAWCWLLDRQRETETLIKWRRVFYTPTLHTTCAPTSQVVSRVRVQLLTIIDQDFFARDGKKYSIKRDFFDAGSSNVWLGSTAKEFMVKVFSTLKVMVVVMMMVVDIMMMMLTTIMVMAVVIYNWRLWLPPAVVIAAFAQDLLFRCYVVICCSCYSVLIVGLERW